jgi:hypothetical protein
MNYRKLSMTITVLFIVALTAVVNNLQIYYFVGGCFTSLILNFLYEKFFKKGK